MTYSYSDDHTRLYDLAGDELAAFDGRFSGFSADEQQLVHYSSSEEKTRLYNLYSYNLFSPIKASRIFLSADNQRLVTFSDGEDNSRLYNLKKFILF